MKKLLFENGEYAIHLHTTTNDDRDFYTLERAGEKVNTYKNYYEAEEALYRVQDHFEEDKRK